MSRLTTIIDELGYLIISLNKQRGERERERKEIRVGQENELIV